jgi:hypothetical protein
MENKQKEAWVCVVRTFVVAPGLRRHPLTPVVADNTPFLTWFVTSDEQSFPDRLASVLARL